MLFLDQKERERERKEREIRREKRKWFTLLKLQVFRTLVLKIFDPDRFYFSTNFKVTVKHSLFNN